MKNKYDRLTREEKKECQNMYYQTAKGIEMRLRFARLNFLGIIGILIGIFIIGNGIIHHQIKWYDYMLSIPLIIASLVFIIGAFLLKRRVLNQFALKIPKFKNR